MIRMRFNILFSFFWKMLPQIMNFNLVEKRQFSKSSSAKVWSNLNAMTQKTFICCLLCVINAMTPKMVLVCGPVNQHKND